MYKSPYGKSERLADRLDDWRHRLGTDKSLPWPGNGLLDDLKVAAATLRGEKIPEPTKTVEYDL